MDISTPLTGLHTGHPFKNARYIKDLRLQRLEPVGSRPRKNGPSSPILPGSLPEAPVELQYNALPRRLPENARKELSLVFTMAHQRINPSQSMEKVP